MATNNLLDEHIILLVFPSSLYLSLPISLHTCKPSVWWRSRWQKSSGIFLILKLFWTWTPEKGPSALCWFFTHFMQSGWNRIYFSLVRYTTPRRTREDTSQLHGHKHVTLGKSVSTSSQCWCGSLLPSPVILSPHYLLSLLALWQKSLGLLGRSYQADSIWRNFTHCRCHKVNIIKGQLHYIFCSCPQKWKTRMTRG